MKSACFNPASRSADFSRGAKMAEKHLGWHFLPADRRLAHIGSEPLEPGSIVEHDGDLNPCYSGLHWSANILDALKYAPGPWCCWVECSGGTMHRTDKSVSRRRKILWMVDCTDLIWDWFADVQEDWVLSLQKLGKSWPELDRYGEMCAQYREGNATADDCARDAKAAWAAWDARDAKVAWDAKVARDAKAAWTARAAWDAWAAWTARAAWDAWAAWDARDARDAWAARDARAARLEALARTKGSKNVV
jgi:hypothetical protein